MKKKIEMDGRTYIEEDDGSLTIVLSAVDKLEIAIDVYMDWKREKETRSFDKYLSEELTKAREELLKKQFVDKENENGKAR